MSDIAQSPSRGYRYLEEIATADVAFAAWGETPEELFRAAADAVLNVMIEDLATIRRETQVSITLEHPDLDLLLFNLLNELVFYKDARMLLLRVDEITITRGDAGFALTAETSGERLDPTRHSQLVDVKAVTLHRFQVEKSARGWEATVVLDI